MLDILYGNIGGKIKKMAKWIFIVEAIGAIIAGLVLMFTEEDFILYGCLKNKDDDSSPSTQYIATENNTIICPLCNFEQPANRKVCWKCGAKFEETIKNTVS